MTAKKTVAIIAVLGLFVFLAVDPVGAKDPLDTSKSKAEVTQAAETAEATAKEATIEKINIEATIEKININKADLAALSQLKGIGPEMAQNILETPEDLMKVKGIGEKTFEQIKPFISVH
jgi:competence protein ComEA